MNCNFKFSTAQKALATYFLREAILKNIKKERRRKKKSFDLEDLILSKFK